MSDSLRQQVAGMIETCKTVLARGKDLPDLDQTTIKGAEAMLTQAKEKVPDDKVLAATVLGPLHYSWTAILSAMETVERTLPLPGQARPAPFSSGGKSGRR